MVEHLDGHTDIIHEQLYSDWFPWSYSTRTTQFYYSVMSGILIKLSICRGMKRRDLLLRRYWRREDDGTYGSSFVYEDTVLAYRTDFVSVFNS